MKYKFIKNGDGIPGLPHEITDEQAKAQGLEPLLKAAIAAGAYAPQPLPKTEQEVKSKKEMTNG